MSSIDKIFLDIRTFILDYVRLCQIIHENSDAFNKNMINIKFGNDDFYLPATFNEYSQRAGELQYHLHRYIRVVAQKRRIDITKGIENDDDKNLLILNHQNQFDENFKSHLEELQKNSFNKNLFHIQVIIDAFELYNDILTKQHFSNSTFRLLPILKHIQKQLCCISRTVQKMLDSNSSNIEQHFKKLQQNLNSYKKTMKNKLEEYIARDIRPPVLVIPCPTRPHPSKIFTQMKSSNAAVDEDDSDTQLTTVSSEDSLTIENN